MTPIHLPAFNPAFTMSENSVNQDSFSAIDFDIPNGATATSLAFA